MKKMKLRTKLAAGFAAATALFGFGCVTGDYNSESVEQATVNSVRTDYHNGQASDRMVYTDNRAYTLNDSYVKMSFDSADEYKKLKAGCTYQFNVHGWDSKLLGTSKNIDSVTFVPTLECPKAPSVA